MAEVKVLGLEEAKRALIDFEKDVKSSNDISKDLSNTLAQKASALAPRLTGALASSVQGNPTEGKIEISAGNEAVPYAGVIEYGWDEKNKVAQPYLRPAVFDQMGYIEQKYNEQIEQSIKKYNLN